MVLNRAHKKISCCVATLEFIDGFFRSFIMKTKIAMLVALAAAGVSFGASAQIDPPSAPAVAGVTTAPSLFPSEQGAFKLLEAAAQVVESRNIQKGCVTKDYPISVSTIFNGSGQLILGTAYPSPDNVILN
jgi:hypothetical protein